MVYFIVTKRRRERRLDMVMRCAYIANLCDSLCIAAIILAD